MLRKLLIFAIKFYKAVSYGRRPCCRFVPSCSLYAIEAIEKYGSFKGVVLFSKRILRCRASFKKYKNCGYDPVQ